MHFSISVMGPGPWFNDIALSCHYALAELGFQAEIRCGGYASGTVPIILGAHALGEEAELPPGAVIYNFEHVSGASFTPRYAARLRAAEQVWDAHPGHIAALREACGVDAYPVFPGYVREMSCLKADWPQDLDVLFYGEARPRRTAILEGLRQRGLNVVDLKVSGPVRDYAICRAALVLNLHQTLPAGLEVARLGYLWANAKAVLSEDCPETGIPAGLEDACCYVPYENLVDAAVALIRKPAWRGEVAERGFHAYAAMPMTRWLEKVVGRRSHAVGGLPVPDTLNAGSGKRFLRHCLNIDINPQWNPDIVADLSRPLEPDAVHPAARFGELRLKPGMFRRIIANDVLEHVADIRQTMRNFLDLLADGGVLEIHVPYDLSLGAWQDPTHVRAFNENSWRYYTEWHWYMGWREHRFDLLEMKLMLTPLGQSLEEQNVPREEVLRTPRAVASMRVRLGRRPTTEAEKMTFDLENRACYKSGSGTWDI